MSKLSQFTTVWPTVTVTKSTTQDGIVVQGREGGSGSFRVTLSPLTLSANRSITFPNVNGTVVTTGDLGSVSAAMVAPGAITNSKIANGAVGTLQIANGAVGTLQIANGSITPSKLSVDAVAPINSPYVIYVNPVTGTDTFEGGSTIGDNGNVRPNQQLRCGYSEARPFKTINRAIIEAGILTAKTAYESPLVNNDLVSIVLSPGVYTTLNGTGSSTISEWPLLKEPTEAEIQAFNPTSTGGVLLPRGVSLCSLDLRKTIIRPSAVPGESSPTAQDELADASNRRSIFKVTGTGYYYGMTFMDKAGLNKSHHLLHCFEFASQAELDEFYGKIRQAFGGPNNTGGLNNALAVTRTSEYEIVGPQPADGSQTVATDTTLSASPYIFNCSVRSNYGLGGVYADGAKTSGFRSMVIAQFTGVSLQRDITCWQKYDSSQSPRWGSYFTDYNDYVSTDPDNVRMHVSRRSFHVRVVNNAIIQEVSVFAIGQGVHHWTQNGGEITITNSNSNFGGCSSISEGYRSSAFTADRNWNVSKIKVSSNLSDITGNVRRIYLGTVSAITGNSVTLVNGLGESLTVPGSPDIVAKDGYSLRSGSRVWIENTLGADWSSTFTSSAWSSTLPDKLNVNTSFINEDGETTDLPGVGNAAIGNRVYIRRLVDTRSPDQRKVSLKLNTTSSSARTPLRDYALQVTAGSPTIASLIPVSSTLLVSNSVKTSSVGAGVVYSSEVVLRRANSSVSWAANNLYRKGDTVKLYEKHYTCITQNSDAVFDPNKWEESYVHMDSQYNPEDFYKTEAPILVFDKDSSNLQDSETLGYDLGTLWNTDAEIQAQYRSAADYKGSHLFLTAMGFSSAQAHTILTPRAESSRERDPSVSGDMGGFVPNGSANALGNWPIEFRRPSIVRLFGHAWEWSGFLNYTKAIPAYQKSLSPQNKFTYYFTNVDGGRVYATGFNEEGFQVSPKGLEDVTTGETLSVESIGSSDTKVSQELNNATLRGTTTIEDTLVLPAAVTFSVGAQGQTTKLGVVTLADAASLRAGTGVSGANDASRNSIINANPAVVTAKGLEFWKVNNRLLSQRSGVQYIYVDPSSPNNPQSIDQLLAAPPTSPESRIASLTAAVLYASSVYSPTETVEFRIGPGIYLEKGILTFKSITNIRAWDFTASTYLNGAQSDGTIPFSAANFYDPSKQPVFLTSVYHYYPFPTGDYNPALPHAFPLCIKFEQPGTITGVAWWGPMTTMSSPLVPDWWFNPPYVWWSSVSADSADPNNWRALAKADPDNAFNYHLRALAVKGATDRGLTVPCIHGVRQLPCVRAYNQTSIFNVAIGAMVPADPYVPAAGPNNFGTIEVKTTEDVWLSGIKFVGNVLVSSAVNTGAFASIRFLNRLDNNQYNLSSYSLTGHSSNLLYTLGPKDKIKLALSQYNPTEGSPGTYSVNYNTPPNNIELFNSLNPPTIASMSGIESSLPSESSGDASYWRNHGPAISSIYDSFGGILTSNRWTWFTYYVKTSDGLPPTNGSSGEFTSNNVVGSSGFSGKFGNYRTTGGLLGKTTGLHVTYPNSLPSNLALPGIVSAPTIFRVAGTGKTPVHAVPPVGGDPGGVSPLTLFSDLNIYVRTTFKGVNVTTGNSADQTMTL